MDDELQPSDFAFSDEDVQSWQIRLAMICQSCPVYCRRPGFCHLRDVAKMTQSAQIDFVKALPIDVLRYALARHDICMEVETDKVMRNVIHALEPKLHLELK